MEHKLKNRVCATNEELWEQIQSVWDSIPLSYIQSLFDSMPKRLRAVKKKNGGTIKYWTLDIFEVSLDFRPHSVLGLSSRGVEDTIY